MVEIGKEKIVETAVGVIVGILITDLLESSGAREEFREGIDNIVDKVQGEADGRERA
jgi:hypothetical protein